jgi:hypothetical protein
MSMAIVRTRALVRIAILTSANFLFSLILQESLNQQCWCDGCCRFLIRCVCWETTSKMRWPVVQVR